VEGNQVVDLIVDVDVVERSWYKKHGLET